MKTQNTSPLVNWIDKTVAKRIVIWTLIFLGIIWLMAPLLNRPVLQPIFNDWVMKGEGVASFPMWGYSWLIRLLGSVTSVVILQSVLGAFATAALMVRLNCLFPRAKMLTTILFITAIPWFSFMAYAYQMPISSALMILTLLALEMALSSSRISWGVIAGFIIGMGQNFRSELFLLPTAILVLVFIFGKLKWFRYASLKPLLVCIGVALVLQVPWALNCYYNARHFSFSESNFGHVAYLGLGTIPSNPWKVDPQDSFAQETVEKAGLNYYSLSFEGGEFLKQKFFDGIRQYPLDYVKCIGARIVGTVAHPFASLSLASPTEGMQGVSKMLKTKPTVVPGAETIAPSAIKTAFSWLYFIASGILNRAISILGIIGFFLAFRKGPFRLEQPIVLLLTIVILYRCGLNIALFPSGKYMTSVYLCYLPFVVNTCWFVKEKLQRNSIRLETSKM